jgi:hypothetical protein
VFSLCWLRVSFASIIHSLCVRYAFDRSTSSPALHIISSPHLISLCFIISPHTTSYLNTTPNIASPSITFHYLTSRHLIISSGHHLTPSFHTPSHHHIISHHLTPLSRHHTISSHIISRHHPSPLIAKATKAAKAKKGSAAEFDWVSQRPQCLAVVLKIVNSNLGQMWPMGIVQENFLTGIWTNALKVRVGFVNSKRLL